MISYDKLKCYLRFFTQMFTIQILKNGHFIPIIFCLLLNKSYETYVYTFHKMGHDRL